VPQLEQKHCLVRKRDVERKTSTLLDPQRGLHDLQKGTVPADHDSSPPHHDETGAMLMAHGQNKGYINKLRQRRIPQEGAELLVHLSVAAEVPVIDVTQDAERGVRHVKPW
jgi:hypothetical protein